MYECVKCGKMGFLTRKNVGVLCQKCATGKEPVTGWAVKLVVEPPLPKTIVPVKLRHLLRYSFEIGRLYFIRQLRPNEFCQITWGYGAPLLHEEYISEREVKSKEREAQLQAAV